MAELVIPVILGTTRQGRMSEFVAKFILEQLTEFPEIKADYIDIRTLPIPLDNAGPEAKIPSFSDRIQQADGYILVVPEYNHSYPGLLKQVLDLCYHEYNHKSVGLCGVSGGAFGGVRAIESLLPILKAFGLKPTIADLNFGQVNDLVDTTTGRLTDEAQATYSRRFQRFMAEFLWLTKTLKYGRENIPLK